MKCRSLVLLGINLPTAACALIVFLVGLGWVVFTKDKLGGSVGAPSKRVELQRLRHAICSVWWKNSSNEKTILGAGVEIFPHFVLTCEHVVRETTQVEVGKSYSINRRVLKSRISEVGRVVYRDYARDLAVVAYENMEFRRGVDARKDPVFLGEQLRVGILLDPEVGTDLTTDVVEIRTFVSGMLSENSILVDRVLGDGYSGSPVFDENGLLVGLYRGSITAEDDRPPKATWRSCRLGIVEVVSSGYIKGILERFNLGEFLPEKIPVLGPPYMAENSRAFD